LIDNEVGQKATEATPAGMAEAIEALFERDLAALSRAARLRAEERHSWERAFTGLMGIYGGLLGDPALAAPARLDG
jgi:alpha-1,6-mannosyltransferase